MKRLTLCLAAALLGVQAVAPAQEIDILTFEDSGKIETALIDVGTAQVVTDVRLFAETFDIIIPGLFGTTAPGYFNNESFPLPPLSDLAFDALAITHPDTQVDANLLYWDGDGAVDFAAPTDGSTLQFRLSGLTNISVDGSAGDVPGFVIEGTGPTGVLHKHISYSARGNAGADPADGLYLASIRLTMAGLADSEPVYLLFNADYQRDAQDNIVFVGDAPQVDPNSETLAKDWIEQQLIGVGLPGDFDQDGDVDLDDFNLLAANFGIAAGATLGQGDANGDGAVDLDDFNLLAANFGSGAEAIGALPEPAVLTPLVLLVGVCRTRNPSRP